MLPSRKNFKYRDAKRLDARGEEEEEGIRELGGRKEVDDSRGLSVVVFLTGSLL